MDAHAVGRVAELPEGEVVRFETEEGAIGVANLGNGELSAFADVCPHRGAWLSQGEVDLGEGTIECLWHHSVFDLRTGKPMRGPASSPLLIRPVRVVGDQLTVGAEE
ncbi:MAG: Rieske 2Fe-2S domain-containing protein [Actinobacteria bacterium]|nr:Rieske 2Fe-2S domain-containing protein [Actinomycetota bacterium]